MHPPPGASGRLQAFQDAFADALLASPAAAADRRSDPGTLAKLTAQPGFAVYRNTVLKGCVDALQANYPTVSRLVGDEWFRAAAVIHARGNLPGTPSLTSYGAGFTDFLEGFEPAGELPYLAGVARLDRFWTEAHVARDEAPVDAASVACLDPVDLARAVLRPHASARWAWFGEQPIYTLWERNRAPDAATDDKGSSASDIAWRAEGALIVRPRSEVRWMALDRAGCVFLDACAAGETLSAAAAAALAADPSADLAALMANTLAAGAFGQLVLPTDDTKELR